MRIICYRNAIIFAALYITLSCLMTKGDAQPHHWTSWWKPGGIAGKRYYNIVPEPRSPWGRKPPASAFKRNFDNGEEGGAELGPILMKLLAGYPERMDDADSTYAQMISDILAYRAMDQKKDEPNMDSILR